MPEAPPRGAARPVVLALACLLAGGGAWYWHYSRAATPAPEPLWHNGVIVEIRNCEAPADEEAELRCAALVCAQRVTAQLTNAQQTTLKLTRYARDSNSGLIQVSGTLEQYLASPTLPTGFTCESAEARDARPVMLFANLPRQQP